MPLVFALFLALAGTNTTAQGQHLPGTNDPSFNTADVINGIEGFSSFVTCIALQPDGKAVVGGNFYSYNGTRRNRIARLNTDGSLDTSFDPGSDFYSGFNSVPQAIVIQEDGKIVVGGNFITYNQTLQNRIVRLNPDGSVDESFATGTGFSGSVTAIALQPDGKIIVAGVFASYNGISRNRIARLNSDGTLDESFNPETGVYGAVQAIWLQSDGKMVVGGSFSYYNGVARNGIARLHTDGSLDTSFNPGQGFNYEVTSVALQADGKVVAGGYFTFFNGTPRSRIARLNTDGSLDTSFAPEAGFNNNVLTVELQKDDEIVVGGLFTNYNGTECNRIARLTHDGLLDTSFNTGAGFNSSVAVVAVQAGGELVVGGHFTSYNESPRFRITSLSSDGMPGNGYIHRKGYSDAVKVIALQPDGKLMVGGDFEFYNGLRRSFITCLNADGTINNAFNYSAGLNSSVEAIAVQPDGKLVVGGRFSIDNGFRITRLNSDGSPDASFTHAVNGVIRAIVLQVDGKLVVGGSFVISNGIDRNRIVRLNSDGSTDISFNTGTGFDAPVYAIAVQKDGKIVVGGGFTSYNGTPCNGIVRLNTDGSLDNSFMTTSLLDGDVNAIVLQQDGKVIAGGSFISGSGVTRTRIARLNANGSLDTSFNVGSGFDGAVSSIALQSDGKFIVGGWYTSFNGTSRNRIARLNADGSLDASFIPGTGFDNNVQALALQSDGKVIVGGNFTSFNGIVRTRIARLYTDGLPLNSAKDLQPEQEVLIYPNPSHGNITVQLSGAEALVGGAKLILHDAMGRQVLSREVTATEAQAGVTFATTGLTSGVYYLTIRTRSLILTKKLVLAA